MGSLDDFDPMEHWKKNHPDYHKQILSDRRLMARFSKAKALEKNGDMAGAIQQYELNIKDAPTWASVKRLAVLYRKTGRYEDEVKLLEQSLIFLAKINAEVVLQEIAARLENARKLQGRRKS